MSFLEETYSNAVVAAMEAQHQRLTLRCFLLVEVEIGHTKNA